MGKRDEKVEIREPAAEARLSKKKYEKQLKHLQAELCALQQWVVDTGQRIVVVFEGRDAAGKGGALKRITERVSPRVFRIVALPAPSEREKTQLHAQRYIAHMPAAGEIMLFDRSWYNRAGVDRVMGFCTDDQYERFLRSAPLFERHIIEDGITLIKYFFDVSPDVQEERFKARATDPRKHWKLSPMDLESWARYWEYTKAYDTMIRATDTDYAPWYHVNGNDKRSARLNCISHLLSLIPYEKQHYELPPLPERLKRGKDVPDTLPFSRSIPEPF